MWYELDKELVYLQVVKEGKNVYSLDFFGPFSPIQAFAMALAEIDLSSSNNFIYIVWIYDLDVKIIKNGSALIQEKFWDAREQSDFDSKKCKLDKEEINTNVDK